MKPSQQALEEFEGLALEDSSDDSDYKVDERVSYLPSVRDATPASDGPPEGREGGRATGD